MNRSLKRWGGLAASVALACSSGCNDATEIPLAKVPPVTASQLAPKKPKLQARITSPSVLPGQSQ